MRARWTAAGLLLLVLPPAAGPAAAATDPPPDGPGARVDRFPAGDRLNVVLPGILISYALPAGADGRRDVVFLVEPRDYSEAEEPERRKRKAAPREAERLPPCPPEPELESAAPRALLRVDRRRAELVTLQEDLPADATAIEAMDLDGDGADELLLIRPGEILRLGGAEPALLREAEGLPRASLHPALVTVPELGKTGILPAVQHGILVLYGRSGGGLAPLASAALPVEGDLQGRTLRLRHAVPRFVGMTRGDEPRAAIFATASDGFGGRRLRTMLVALVPDGESVSTEAWSALPTPEEVLERHFLLLDGQPVLLVATRPGDKLALFGEKRLRIFPLERDRSHLGIDPIFAAESKMNLWQDSVAVLADVDGNGTEDLVVGYWTGLVDVAVALDVYLRNEDGTFRTSPRTTSFDVPEADRDFLEYGSDLDGDGRGDLLVQSDGQLLLYPGLPSRNGKKIVDWRYFAQPPGGGDGGGSGPDVDFALDPDAPPWPMPRSDGAPRIVDLDSDGVGKVILLSRGSDRSPATFQIVSFERSRETAE